MSVRNFGKDRAAGFALAAAMLAAAAPANAQESGTTTQPPPRPIDFRLQPENDGRAPGVQGPADNGLPPVAPGERRGQPAPTPAPSPAPTSPATPPRVVPTQPDTAATPAPTPARRAAPVPTDTPRPGVAPAPVEPTPAADTASTPTLPPNESATTGPAVAADTADDAPTASTSAPARSGTPLWAWALAALAAAGAGLWYWRRRAAPAGPELDDAPEAPPAMPAPRPAPPLPKAATPRAPAAPPSPAQRPAAQPAAPLVTRPAAERRAVVGMALEIRSIRFAADHVAVGFALNLLNEGSAAATGLMVRIAVGQGSAMTEPVLGRFFDGAGGSVLRDDMALAPGAGEELSTEVMLPRTAIEPLSIGGKPMLVPVMAIDVTYHWDGEGDAFGQNAGSFVLGRELGPGGGDKLAPLALDRAAYSVDRPAARPTAIRRSQ